MAALRAANPDVNIKDEDYIACEIYTVYEAMVIVVDYDDWKFFRQAKEHARIKSCNLKFKMGQLINWSPIALAIGEL